MKTRYHLACIPLAAVIALASGCSEGNEPAPGPTVVETKPPEKPSKRRPKDMKELSAPGTGVVE
ncbi:hypothetical protein [Paludisphaera soli]|uniref:hypothetical protein n=1 Tax=Paludisphaera soli TaxID=2712865 RepID=UPI0013EE11CF|nr:hypothetical protein [Paludisphaera soli]